MFNDRKLAGAFAVAIAAGALGAQGAAARFDNGYNPAAAPKVTHARPATDLRSPDSVDRGTRAVQTAPQVDLRSPDSVDRGTRGAVPPTPSVDIVRVGDGGSGFDWGDAAIGAGGVLALMLLALGGALGISRRRQSGGRSALAR